MHDLTGRAPHPLYNPVRVGNHSHTCIFTYLSQVRYIKDFTSG